MVEEYIDRVVVVMEEVVVVLSALDVGVWRRLWWL